MTQDRLPFFSLTAALIGAAAGLITGVSGTAVLMGLNPEGVAWLALSIGVPFSVGLAVLAILAWKMRPPLTVLFPVLTPLIYFTALHVAVALADFNLALAGLVAGGVGGVGVALMVAAVFRPTRSAAHILLVTGLAALAGAGLLPLMDMLSDAGLYALHMGWHAVVLGGLNGLLSGKARA